MAANMTCLWKPAQSGKTRTIQQIIRDDNGVKNHLNILICSNNRLLVAQTNARMTTDLYDEAGSVDEDGPSDDTIVGGVYSWMSGTKKTNIDVDALAWKVVRNKVSMIVCCAHKARFRYLHRLLEELEEAKYDKPVNVWIDEADVSVKHWSGEFNFSRFPRVREVTLVSATFDAVFDHYERIRVMPFPETHPSCYLGLRDCELSPFEADVRDSGVYMDAVIGAHPEFVKPGMKLFVPGDIERKSHDAIARYLLARGCIVLVLNGETKAFLFPDGRKMDIEMTVDEENPLELSQILAAMYATHGMEQCPFAVTGQLCLGRGITFQSMSFTFDAAIIPGMKDASTAYQCVARVLGNVRNFSPFTPTVYMHPILLDAVLRQERIAMYLAQLVHENEWADVGAYEIAVAAGDVSDIAWSTEEDGSPKTLPTAVAARTWGTLHLTETPSAMHPCDELGGKTAETHYKLRGEKVPILPVREFLSSTGRLKAGQGKKKTNEDGEEKETGAPRCHPVFVDGVLRFLVVYKKRFLRV
jgi:hypothetical protein